jgi:hypothetical protein
VAKNPELRAREGIGALLSARWLVQDADPGPVDSNVGLGAIVREFPLDTGHPRGWPSAPAYTHTEEAETTA